MSSKFSLHWCLEKIRLRQVKTTVEYVVDQDEVSAKPATLKRKKIQSMKPALKDISASLDAVACDDICEELPKVALSSTPPRTQTSLNTATPSSYFPLHDVQAVQRLSVLVFEGAFRSVKCVFTSPDGNRFSPLVRPNGGVDCLLTFLMFKRYPFSKKAWMRAGTPSFMTSLGLYPVHCPYVWQGSFSHPFWTFGCLSWFESVKFLSANPVSASQFKHCR